MASRTSPFVAAVSPGTDMRELVSVRPYIIRYRVLGDQVIILRIRHASQRPTDP